jgi:galactokinase
MDQSASVLSEKGSALYVQFDPTLSVRHIKFPRTEPSLVFMIAQSFVKADKKVSGPFHYNLRVVECTLAAIVLLRCLLYRDKPSLPNPLPSDDSPLNLSLGTVFNAFWDANKNKRPEFAVKERLVFFIEKILPEVFTKETYSKKEIAAILNVDEAFLDNNFIKKRFPVPAERFRLGDRAKHVFSETLRVHEFMDLLERPRAESVAPAEFTRQLGHLLNESQRSCRDNFDCSTQDLDLICMYARDAGSLGSRLTGAGWGGATVHLVPSGKVYAVRDALRKEYYDQLWVDGKKLTEEQIDNAVIVSRPGSGSAVFPLDPKGDYVLVWQQEAGSLE